MMKNILLIDDDDVFRLVIKATLTSQGFEVAEAHNGQEGINLARTSNPDLVLSDLYMDNGDGYSVLEELSKAEATASIPVIIMTGQGDVEKFRRGMELGAVDFLQKPFDEKTLLAAIHARLRHREHVRQEAEQMLRLQATALDAAANGIVITDVQGRILMANKAFTTLTGYSLAEAKGLNPRVLKSGRHEKAFYGEMWQTILDGRVWHGELINRRKDGTLYPEEMTITPVADKQGQITHFIAIKRDISERRSSEERLKASQALYYSLLESLPVCLFRKDVEGRLTFANTRFCRAIQRTWEEIEGKTDFDLFPADLAAKYQHDDRLVIEHGKALETVERNVTPDGQAHSVQVIKSPVYEADGRISGMQGIFWDVTEQRLAEEALRESVERFRVLFENSSDAIMVLTREGFTTCNPAALKLFGCQTVEQLVQLHPGQLSPVRQPDGKDSMVAANERIVEALERGKVCFEWMHRRADGEEFPAEVMLTAFTHRDRQMIQATVRDLSERIRADKQRAAIEVQLRHAQKLESIGQLAAGIAHEINTPTQYVGDNLRFLQDAFKDLLQLLRSYAELLAASRQGPAGETLIAATESAVQKADLEYLMAEIPKAIEQSLGGVDRVAKIVRAMKEFSHPGAKEKTRTDLNHAIDSTITVARNEWKYVADLKTDFAPALPLVPCLPDEFNQVILNLIINAAHAIADVVGEGNKGKGTITVSTRRLDAQVEVRIQDTGTGIPEKTRNRIFEPFFTTKPVGKGTGQGLAIARSVVVDKHGGTIDFETETGKGTTFIIRLPLAANKEPNASTQP
jgi:PAS domain S-box-containing protein